MIIKINYLSKVFAELLQRKIWTVIPSQRVVKFILHIRKRLLVVSSSLILASHHVLK